VEIYVVVLLYISFFEVRYTQSIAENHFRESGLPESSRSHLGASLEVLFRGEDDQQRVAQDEPAEVLGRPLEMIDDRKGVVAAATQDLHHPADFLNP
jgi:hypothetical protein